MGTFLIVGCGAACAATLITATVPAVRARSGPNATIGSGSVAVFFFIAALAYPATRHTLGPTLALGGLFATITHVLLARTVNAWRAATGPTPLSAPTVSPSPRDGAGRVETVEITAPVAPDQPGTGRLSDGTTRIVHSESVLPVGTVARVIDHITSQAIEAAPTD